MNRQIGWSQEANLLWEISRLIDRLTQVSAANSGSGVTTFNTRTGDITLLSTDVTTALGFTPVPTTRTLTINGTTYDLSADRTFTVSAANIYTADGTLTGNRSLTHGGFNLSFIGSTFTNRFTSAGRLLLGTTSESTFILDVFGPVRLYPRGAANGGFEFTFSDIYNYLHSNAYTFVSSNSSLAIGGGGSGVTYLGVNKSFVVTPVTIGNDTGRAVSASAILDIYSTTKGILPPRMTNAQRVAISSPAVGLIVYCTDATEGLYQYINNAWVNLTGVVTNRQTASYTLALGDSNDLVEMNVATANNLTIPLDSSVAFPIGTKIDIAQYGAGQTTVVATGGVTIRSAGGALKLAAQYSGATLVKIATNEWYLFGDITV